VRIERLQASVHWRALLRGRLVADFRIEAPDVHINRRQLQQEARDEERLRERGWQAAVRAIYPLKMNRVVLENGRFTYIDSDPRKPVTLSAIQLTTENIRNVFSAEGVYPSPFSFTAQVFDKGRADVKGRANLLAEPHPALEAEMVVRDIDLGHFEPIAARYRLDIGGGHATAEGHIEYAPRKRIVRLKEVRIDQARIAYRHSGGAGKGLRAPADGGDAVVAKDREETELRMRIDDFRLTGELGFVNIVEDSSYYLFFRQTSVRVTNLSNHFRDGPAEAAIQGRFMASGDTRILARFRPEADGPDFDLYARIVGTEAAALNDMLRAYANFDVTEGRFSLFTEIHVQNQRVDGYVKPFFKDLEIYDAGQESEQPLFQKLYEGVIEGIAEILKNESSDRVATKTDISGPIEDPEADTWQVIANLIRNAFFNIILPGFEPGGGTPGDSEGNAPGS
jgi:hypothetical protein